jgi:predicted MFS family arabinose efflux permease
VIRHPAPLCAVAARRVFLLLTVTRWFPVGLVIGVLTLIGLQRGMSVAQLGAIFAAQGLVVLALELPTGGFADALGRRPVLVASAVVNLASMGLFLAARSFWAFFAALALQGVFRALDSGPLEAWYVDTAHADDPTVPVEKALAAAGTVLGVAIATGALVSGGLIAWHPVTTVTAIELPAYVALALGVVHLVAVATLMKEPRTHVDATGFRRAVRSAQDAPRTVADGIRLLGSSRVLLALVLVEVFWSVGMIAFETFHPIRLAELVGGEDRAGAILGPVSAAAWGLFAAGSAAAGLSTRRIGVAWTAVVARVVQGIFIVVMGLMAGPVGLVSAFLVTYSLHGFAGPAHATLLHRQASPTNRATVLSMNSMVAGGTYSLALLALGPFAEHTSTALAIVVCGAFSILGAVLYLPAVRQERTIAEPALEVEPVTS